jgi:hypothetical protein
MLAETIGFMADLGFYPRYAYLVNPRKFKKTGDLTFLLFLPIY